MYNFIFMKNEKLELLLNKVVEFNKPDAVNFKGFLYKDSKGYYIKVVEAISGTDVAEKDILYLKDGEEQYVIHADKPKLMRVDKKSWHYQLMQYVLGSKTPTPQNMQNGCPYFWLLVFSLFASIFVTIGKTVKFVFLLIPKGFVWCLQKSVDAWLASIDDVTAYDLYTSQYGQYNYRSDAQKLPITAKIFFDTNDDTFFNYFLKKKYGEGANFDGEKKKEIEAKWQEWRKEVRKARDLKNSAEALKREEQERREYAREQKRIANQEIWDARMKPLVDAFKKFFASIKQAFTFKIDTKSLIKRTKQVVGVIITLLLLTAAFFFVEYFALALMIAIDACIKHWYILVGVICGVAVVGLLYFVGVFVGGWLQNIINIYKKGKKIWYIEPLIYLIWYPVKYIGLAIGYTILYVLWKPLFFVFYTVLVEIVIINLSKLTWKALCAIGRGLANSTGVFGEYFHADYTGLCPGLEWTGFDEEEKKK
jgi:uncharacterized FlaG/YvyC family protein